MCECEKGCVCVRRWGGVCERRAVCVRRDVCVCV